MAMILEFRRTERPAKPESVDGEQASAEIVIFPGVRYEYWGEAERGNESEPGSEPPPAN